MRVQQSPELGNAAAHAILDVHRVSTNEPRLMAALDGWRMLDRYLTQPDKPFVSLHLQDRLASTKVVTCRPSVRRLERYVHPVNNDVGDLHLLLVRSIEGKCTGYTQAHTRVPTRACVSPESEPPATHLVFIAAPPAHDRVG